MKLIKDYLLYIDHFLMQYHHFIKDGSNLDALLLIVNHDLQKVDSTISSIFKDDHKGFDINEYGLKYLFKFDQWLRQWRQDMKFQDKILEEPLDAFKHYVMEELELSEDGVF